MYSLSDLAFALRSPRSLVRELNRLCHTRGRRTHYNPDGIAIFEEDWDNLVILDAGRYDYFVECSELPGETSHARTRGTSTREFVTANFDGRVLHDTVYVTANSWYNRLRDGLGSEVHKLVDLHMGDGSGDYHSDRFKVVLPDTVTDHAVQVAADYPNKRLIVHYLQPHHPFIGPTGRQFQTVSSNLPEVIADTPPALVRRAYRENVEIVLDSVADLLPSLEGKTVVTADHGEMLGDRHDYVPMRDYGHVPGMYNDALTKVPWHVYRNGPRKRIVAETPETTEDVDVDRLERRLEDLGYKI